MINIDTRIIAATNRDLVSEVDKGNFRRDLYYRLNVITLRIEPLRNRREDILPLMSNFLGPKYNQISDSDKRLLSSYNWPGNVRELENAAIHYNTLSAFPGSLTNPPHSSTESCKTSNSTDILSVESSILKIIMENTQLYHGIGRMQLNTQLKFMDIHIGDSSLRNVLQDLQEKGLITKGKGRSGTKITEAGIRRITEK